MPSENNDACAKQLQNALTALSHYNGPANLNQTWASAEKAIQIIVIVNQTRIPDPSKEVTDALHQDMKTMEYFYKSTG